MQIRFLDGAVVKTLYTAARSVPPQNHKNTKEAKSTVVAYHANGVVNDLKIGTDIVYRGSLSNATFGHHHYLL